MLRPWHSVLYSGMQEPVRIVAVQLSASLIQRWAMSKYFRPWNIDQTLLLPPNVQDFVPKGHVSRFIVELVRESLDLKEITGSYVSGLGQPPFDPRIMVALLLHGYWSRRSSSRRIAKACRELNEFVRIGALEPPDFRITSDFLQPHLM